MTRAVEMPFWGKPIEDPVEPSGVEPSYWGEQSPKGLVGKVLSFRKENDRVSQGSSLFVKALRGLRYYFGAFDDFEDWGDTAIKVIGESGQVLEFSANYYRYLLRQQLTVATAEELSYSVSTGQDEFLSLLQARMGSKLLDHYYEAANLRFFTREVAEIALAEGTGFGSVTWDPLAGRMLGMDFENRPVYEGDLEYRSYEIPDIFWDYRRKVDWKYQDWCCVRYRVNKWTLAAQFPEHASLIESAGLSQMLDDYEDIGANPTEEDDVWLYRYWHRPTLRMPYGRETLFIEEQWLLDGPNPYGRLPVYLLRPEWARNQVLGWSPGFSIQQQQEALNELLGKILTKFDTLGLPMIWTSFGDKPADPSLWAGKIAFVKSEKKPEVIELSGVPDNAMLMIREIIQDMEIRMGMPGAVQGQSQAGFRSGRQQVFSAAQTERFQSPFLQEFEKFFEEIGTATLEGLRLFAPPERLVEIAGPGAMEAQISYMPGGVYNPMTVVVERTAPLLRTPEGRFQLLEILANMGLVIQKEEVLSILQGAPIEALTAPTQSQLDRVNGENDMFLQNPQFQHQVLATDNHILDIQKHAELLNDPRARLDPTLMERVGAAILEHMTLLAQPGQQQLQAMLGFLNLPPALGGGDEGPRRTDAPPQREIGYAGGNGAS